MDDIKYYKNSEIDLNLWDQCIDKCYNGLVYPYSFVLNNLVGKKWDALILGNYQAVFPLVWGRKFGFKFLYQPFFCQQLGLFSRVKITEKIMSMFMEKIPSSFRYWDFHLNYENKYYSSQTSFKNRSSFCIDLNQPYHEIYDQYKPDAKKNLAKSVLSGFEMRKNCSIEMVADCFFETYGSFYPNTPSLKENISACAIGAIQKSKGFTRAVFSLNGELYCAGFFFISHQRIHYAMAAPTEAGKKIGATHILIDEVVKEFSAQNLTFDFEGSDIESVAYFYSKFGSKAHFYQEIISNRLPWWCKFLKS